MNESSRKEVESVIEILGEAGKRLEAIIESEWRSSINMSESDKSEDAEESFIDLDCAADCIGRARRELKRAIGG